MLLQNLKNKYHWLQALQANIKYGFPYKKLKFVGVTGTDGKTTTSSMIYHILKESGLRVGLISTVKAEYEVGGETKTIDTGLHVTTPEPWDLPKLLAEMIDAGIEYVVVESTSSGLHQNRLQGVEFDASVITNIGVDHLDYHKTWENYANAKLKIVGMTNSDGLVVLNKDHKSIEYIREKKAERENTEEIAKDLAKNLKRSIDGMKFMYKEGSYDVPLIGDYNLENSLQAIEVAEWILAKNGVETPKAKIQSAIASYKPPKGRMNVVGQNPYTIIDFAHTPSSLESALKAITPLKPEADSRIICVFGCAGERDRARRKMGEVSARLADITIVTLEDPRSEKIKDINDEIIEHAKKANVEVLERFDSHKDFEAKKDATLKAIKNNVVLAFDYDEVQNRKDAISIAIEIASKKDIIFITGKGHETTLAIGNPTIEHKWSDFDVF